ncbi:hypothetical protein BOTBODRAFT_649819 [Botryobasidium botryosum FD-172 SS1]|uniref:Uncharacterized protein n=1 Tax=Botryobasidium botryosum (strain FD-172 SS1) TaxID=930990 RepID=A0A067LVF8_BOTB1|nr:hypothetical protein BOTBODRAFT_649819 [Botryobasidium botryosum FD-172 SS1]
MSSASFVLTTSTAVLSLEDFISQTMSLDPGTLLVYFSLIVLLAQSPTHLYLKLELETDVHSTYGGDEIERNSAILRPMTIRYGTDFFGEYDFCPSELRTFAPIDH